MVIRLRSVASLQRQAPILSKRSPQRWLVTEPRCPLAVSRQCRHANPVQRQSLPRQLISGSELTGRQTRPSDLLTGLTTPSLAILSPSRHRLRHHRLRRHRLLHHQREMIIKRPSKKPCRSTGKRTAAGATTVAATTTVMAVAATTTVVVAATATATATATVAATETGAEMGPGQAEPGPQVGQVEASRREAGVNPTTDAIT